MVIWIVIIFESIQEYWSKISTEKKHASIIKPNVHLWNNSVLFWRTHNSFKSIKVTSTSTTNEVIGKALTDFGMTNVSPEKYSLVEVLLISNVNYTHRVLEPNEYPLHVLRQQRRVIRNFIIAQKPPTHKLDVMCSFLFLGICSQSSSNTLLFTT